ncbi:MAG: ComEA family DNA-binding protein [Erysipelotrichaceae bacterium]
MVNQTIEVNVKGNAVKDEVYVLKRGSTISDLLKMIDVDENVDLSCMNLNMLLKNKDVIVFDIKEDVEKISINSASLQQLIEIPYVGEKTALLIIEYRSKNGGFKSLEEIMEIRGIGPKKFEKMKDYIRL